MEIFGIGAPEILLIMVVALIVFGPEKLPEIAREAGKMVRQFRRMTSEATSEIRSLTNDLGVNESLNEFKSAASVVTNEVKSVKSEVTGAVMEQYKAITDSSKTPSPDQIQPVVTATTHETTEAERAEFNQRRLAELAANETEKPNLIKNAVESSEATASDPYNTSQEVPDHYQRAADAGSEDSEIANRPKPRIARRTASGVARHRERE
jgi:Tat protein translocase TatB subunit